MQHETTRVQHDTTRGSTSATETAGIQHEKKRVQHEGARVQNNLKFILISSYHRCIPGAWYLIMLQNLEN